jgi:hypothetical protein
MSTDFRSLCVELLRAWQFGDDIAGPMNRARAELAKPEPVATPLDCDKIDVPAYYRGADFNLYREGYAAGWGARGIAAELEAS